MIYKNEYRQTLSEWEAFYSSFKEKAEDCYLRWINQDQELTDAEVKLAVDYQQMIEAEEGTTDEIEIEIPPEHEISPEELTCFVKVIDKLKAQGFDKLLSIFAGVTIETTQAEKSSSKVSNIKALESQYFTTDTRVF